MVTMALQSRTALSAIMAGVALMGCAAGPDFRPPEAPVAQSYTAAALPDATVVSPGAGGVSQRFVSGLDIPHAWWTLFRSAPLDKLIRQALVDSPTLTLAQARIREALENRRAQFGALYPSLDAGVSATRQRITGAAFGQPEAGSQTFTLFNASVEVSYSLDLFGATRRRVEALDAQIEYQQFQLEGARLTLAANIVTAAVKEASLRSQLSTTREIAAVLAKELDVVERRLQAGGATLADVLAQRTQLVQNEAALPPLERDLEQTRHQLAVLIGRPPGEAAFPGFDLDAMRLPEDVPVSLPSALVRQRPDIRAAEALLHSASARVGAATANLYPQVTLTGNLGSVATTAAALFDSASAVWNLGAGLMQPVFHGGTLTAQRSAAVAVYDQAMAQYREVVLQSFQNVADVLRALESGARSLKALAEAELIARDGLELSRKQFTAGAVSYLSLLNAERQYQEARLGAVSARAARLADTAALFQAMGGGWWNRPAQEESGTGGR
jgi:NodT family efflux transporter outer membrane factor (OMF) lipoprotein